LQIDIQRTNVSDNSRLQTINFIIDRHFKQREALSRDILVKLDSITGYRRNVHNNILSAHTPHTTTKNNKNRKQTRLLCLQVQAIYRYCVVSLYNAEGQKNPNISTWERRSVFRKNKK
jgi:hypothetical protein